MNRILLATVACFWGMFPALGQPGNAPRSILSGATLTLDLNAAVMKNGAFSSGEKPWWTIYQLAPQPFTSPSFRLSLGLPPNASFPVTAPLTSNSYWSGYIGEYEAYPNYETLKAFNLVGNVTPVKLTRGNVDLTASLMPLRLAKSLPPNLAGRKYLSGAFNTYPFSQLYGYFEITARIPSGQAEFPAFWLVPVNMNTGVKTEIDIMEAQGNNTSVYWTTLHSSDYAKSAPTYGQSGLEVSAGTDLSKGYHRYGVAWKAGRIVFYLDRVAVFSAATPSDMHVPMYIIANLALGGWMGSPSSATPSSATFSISSLRVWRLPDNR